jgi:hypothetical protein
VFKAVSWADGVSQVVECLPSKHEFKPQYSQKKKKKTEETKEVSQCIPAVSMLYFDQFNPFCFFPLPFSPTPHYSTAFSTYCYVLCLHRYNAF